MTPRPARLFRAGMLSEPEHRSASSPEAADRKRDPASAGRAESAWLLASRRRPAPGLLPEDHRSLSNGLTPAILRLTSSGEMTNRSRSSVSKRVSSLLMALKTLVSIGVTWISEVSGQFNNATKRLLGSGRSRSSTSSHFHHARRQGRQRAATAAPAKRRRVHNSLGAVVDVERVQCALKGLASALRIGIEASRDKLGAKRRHTRCSSIADWRSQRSCLAPQPASAR